MVSKARPPRLKSKKTAILLLLGLLSFFVLSFDLYNLFYLNKVYPRTIIMNSDFTGLDYQETLDKLSQVNKPVSVVLVFENQNFNLSLEEAGIKYNDRATTQKALLTGRSNNIFLDTKNMINALVFGIDVPLSYSLDQALLEKSIENIARKVETPSENPSIDIAKGEVRVNLGKNGKNLDREGFKNSLFKSIENGENAPILLAVKANEVKLSEDQAKNIQKVASVLLGKQLVLKFEDQEFNYEDRKIIEFLNLYSAQPDEKKVGEEASLITKTVNRMPEDARFVFEDGKVKEFNPGKEGVQVNTPELEGKLNSTIATLSNGDDKKLTVLIPVTTSKPQVMTEDVNNFGIKELIGKGESAFRGSVPNRVYNITLASERLNGILIKPGEEFSFLKALGDVNVYTGYKQAYVIRDGKTVLGDGGGVCQVSSTFFRAALASGLPILERHQHSYRVSYYEQDSKLGLDATVFEPSVDLRIKNDTPGYILIQTKLDLPNSRLAFEFYGTSDGRKAEISNFRSWDVKDPPPALYIDDPTLPAGTTKQTEHAIKGIKTAFDYKVERNAEVLQDKTFYSNYRAWQAIYLRGTAGQ